MLLWATYPYTTLLKSLYQYQVKTRTFQDPPQCPEPVYVEMIAIVERLLNFAHTGNAAVLPSTLMKHLTISQAILKHGFPYVPKTLLSFTGSRNLRPTMDVAQWPLRPGDKRPMVASQRAQELTYGRAHFTVCVAHRFCKDRTPFLPSKRQRICAVCRAHSHSLHLCSGDDPHTETLTRPFLCCSSI